MSDGNVTRTMQIYKTPFKPAFMNSFGCSLIFLLMLVTHATSNAEERTTPSRTDSDSKLQPYIRCDGFAGGVRAVILDRRPQTAEPWRAVDLDGSSQRVSVVDGYRVIYSYVRTYAFANLKAERSDPSRYPEDKRIVISELVEMAKTDGAVDLVDFSHGGFSGQTLTKRALGGRALAKSQIFSDEDSIIVSIFFLNHAPENRKFRSYDEFISLRDAFIRGYIDCVAKKKSGAIRSQ